MLSIYEEIIITKCFGLFYTHIGQKFDGGHSDSADLSA